MTGYADELRELRARLAELEALADRLQSADVSGGRAFVAATYNNGAYPTAGAAGKTFAVKAADVTGTETEGSAATINVRAGVFFAVNLAAGLPTAGTFVVLHEVPGAFVFNYP